MRHRSIAILLAGLLLTLAACQSEPEPISIKVIPAVLAPDAGPEAASWDTVTFAGGQRAPAGLYRIAPEPLFTEWNILTFRSANQPDGSMAIALRFNAYAQRKLEAYSADPANQKQPLVVTVDDRIADVMPLLDKIDDRMTLYGFTAEDIERLQHYIDTK